MGELNEGDLVNWKTSGGTARGPIEKVLTTRGKVGGRTVAATPSNPRYVVRNEATGRRVAKNAAALTPVTATRRGIRLWPLAAALGAAAVALVVVFVILGGDDAETGREYAEDANPALSAIDVRMNKVYAGVDETLSGGDPVKYNIAKFRSHVRGFERTVEAAFAAETKAYDVAQGKIEAARASFEENASSLTGDGSDLEEDADATADEARAYVDSSTAFLEDYEGAIEYFRARLKLDRVRVLHDTGTGGTSIEDFRRSTLKDVKRLEQLQADYEALTPPAGYEALHDELNALAALDLERQRGLADGLARIREQGSGVVDLTEGDDAHLAAYREVQEKLSTLEVNAAINALRTDSAVIAAALTTLADD